MNLLFRVLRAAHARGTHHKLALDALRHLTVPEAEAWQRLLLKHHERYLTGAKAPDDEFKDFKNHVLHVRDGYWGGAPEKVREWYQALVAALRRQDWSEAAWSAGVLSHYYTDPIHPFHTAQSEAENNVHRAVEWSISRSYDFLYALAEHRQGTLAVELPAGDNWLAELVCGGAERANRSYEALISHYDFHRGVVDPPAGLDDQARALVADLILYASTSYARVLDRAIAEAGVAPAQVTLGLDTLLATLKIPLKALLKKLEDRADRLQVERIYDELKATGRVVENMTEDERVVAEAYGREVVEPRKTASPSEIFPLPKPRTGVTRPTTVPTVRGGPRPTVPPTPPAPSVGGIERQVPRPAASPVVVAPTAVVEPQTEPPAPATAASPALGAPAEPSVAAAPPPPQPVEAAPSAAADAAPMSTPNASPSNSAILRVQAVPLIGQDGGRRRHLRVEDDVVDAPSIGPKTAERLKAVGVATVADLLAADPGALEEALGVDHIRARTLADWQDQARLVCDVPGLRGTHAQLLVGAGYRDLAKIARAEPRELCAAVLRFCQTSEGQRVLRQGEPPDLEKVKQWHEAAIEARAAKAA